MTTGVARKELRQATDVANWLAAGLALRRVAIDDDIMTGQAILACASELGGLPPPGVVADLAALLSGTRLPVSMPIAADDPLRAAIRAYDDDVLARLASTARFDDVLAAFAHLRPGERPIAVSLVVGAVCERAGFVGLPVSPAALRRAFSRPRQDSEAAAWAELRTGSVNAARLAEAYLRLARGARQSRALIDDREVFAIDHLAVLGSFGRRLAADHIAAAAEGLARTLPRRLPPKREHRGHRETELADDSTYPAGGFTAITPGGDGANIENLVTSELVYMEDDEAVDLFTLRYLEGELLHYTRDDSVFRRRRHQITIALGPDLDDARVKDPTVPWQRLVLALGLVVAAIRWLTNQLGDRALSIHLAFPPRLLGEERELVSLLLEGEITAGTVIVVEQTWQEAMLHAAATTFAISDLVVVSLGPVPEIPRGQRALHLCLNAAVPTVAELAPRPAAADPEADSGAKADIWAEWTEVSEELLRWLV